MIKRNVTHYIQKIKYRMWFKTVKPTHTAFTVTGFSAFNQRAVESGFKSFIGIINLAEKCGKIIHVKGLSCVRLCGNNSLTRLPFNVYRFLIPNSR